MNTEDQKLALEHRDVLLAVRDIIKSPSGRTLFKYLFKNLEVTELPEIGIEGSMLMDKLGFLRAGNSIFKLAAEADADTAGQLIALIEKERYAELYKASNIGAPTNEPRTGE